MTSTATEVRELVVRLDSTLELLNKMPPFRDRDGILDKASAVLDNVQAASQSMADLRQGVQDRKSNAVQGGVALLTAPLNRLNTVLSNAKTAVAGIQQSLTNAQTAIAQAKANVMRAVNLAVIVSTVLLIWLVLSQVSFFMHGMDMAKAKPAIQTVSTSDAPADDLPVAPPAERLAAAEATATSEAPPSA